MMSIRSILFVIALLGTAVAGCSLFQPRYPDYPDYGPPMLRDTALLEFSRVHSRCDPLQDTARCKNPDIYVNRAHLVLWNGYVKANADSGGLPHMNGYPLVPERPDHHGGPWVYQLSDTTPALVARCNGEYNVAVVPAMQDMPPIVDSIRIPGRFELLEPGPGDTIGFDGVLVRWSPVPGERLSIVFSGPGSTGRRGDVWTVDAGLGSYLIPASDLELYQDTGVYHISLDISVSDVRSTAGRPYSLRCWCLDAVKVWMRAR